MGLTREWSNHETAKPFSWLTTGAHVHASVRGAKHDSEKLPVVFQECAEINEKWIPIVSVDQPSTRRQSLKECTLAESTSYSSNSDFARVNVHERKLC